MKKYKIYTVIALLFVAVVGCKDFLDINTNPNAPSVTVPGLVLSGALTETARIHEQDMNPYAAYWCGYWAASGTYSSSGDVRRFFNLTNTSFQGVWTNNYLNASNYNYVETSSAALAGYDYYVAISKIMKVYNFQTLVDNYGMIPYTSALKGFANLSPTYQDDSQIYESLSAQLDSAVDIIDNAPANAVTLPPTVDIMFGGDMTAWQRLANTMNLRLLLRQSEAGKDAFITAEVAKIKANGHGFLAADARINPGYAKAAGLQNPFWESNGLGVGDDIGGRDYNRSSEYGLAFFVNHNDPRVNRLFRNIGDPPGVSSATNYKGIPFGEDPDIAFTTANTSGPGLGVLGSAAQPVYFLSNAQSAFLQAEAILKAWDTGTAFTTVQEAYEAGVHASFTLLGVPNASTAADAYLINNQPLVDFSLAITDADKLEYIMVQKWAGNYSIDAMEAWCDLRRTGYPDDLPESQAAAKINPTPPIRLLYPQTELSNNAGAVAKTLADQGLTGNYQFGNSIFWDAN